MVQTAGTGFLCQSHSSISASPALIFSRMESREVENALIRAPLRQLPGRTHITAVLHRPNAARTLKSSSLVTIKLIQGGVAYDFRVRRLIQTQVEDVPCLKPGILKELGQGSGRLIVNEKSHPTFIRA